jgi:hypothetical protein
VAIPVLDYRARETVSDAVLFSIDLHYKHATVPYIYNFCTSMEYCIDSRSFVVVVMRVSKSSFYGLRRVKEEDERRYVPDLLVMLTANE